MDKARLVLTARELEAVKQALFSFVTKTLDPEFEVTQAEIEAAPIAADVLLKHFKGW